MLDTKRLRIREARPEDIPYIIDMENHPDNRDFIWQGSLQEHLEEIADENHILAILTDRKTQERVGYFLAHINFKSEIFELRRIALEIKGKGYGRETISALFAYAFETRQLNRFWLDVYPHNHIGIRLYESLGMKREGILRENYKNSEGRYLDQIIYSLLAREWKN